MRKYQEKLVLYTGHRYVFLMVHTLASVPGDGVWPVKVSGHGVDKGEMKAAGSLVRVVGCLVMRCSNCKMTVNTTLGCALGCV